MIRNQMLQQEAYPAIRPLLTPKTRPSLKLSTPKTCLRYGRSAVQDFMPIGIAPAEKSVTIDGAEKSVTIDGAEKSVTIDNEKVTYSKLSIPPYTTYYSLLRH